MKRKFCAIVDANSLPEVVSSANAASQIFVEFLAQGLGMIHIGGQLRNEWEANQHHRTWISNGIARGWIKNVDNGEVERKTQDMMTNPKLRSNDPHIVALAQVGGARLLVSRDVALGKDFKDKQFLENPRGKVFPSKAKSSYIRNFLRKTPLSTRHASRN